MQNRRSIAVALPAPAFAAPRAPSPARQPRRIRAILDGLRWRRPAWEEPAVTTVAETAECGCPDWCHRDHENE